MTATTGAKAPSTKKKTATAAKKGTAVSTDTVETETEEVNYEVSDEAPAFIRTQGRAKSPLRKSIEDLEVGKYLNTRKSGLDAGAISSVSQMKRAVEEANPGVKLSVRQGEDEKRTIWVHRKA